MEVQRAKTRLSALHLMLEFGSSEEKVQAMRDVKHAAFEGGNQATENAVDDSEEDVAQDDSSDDSDLLRPLS
jgi:hypothetical protein